MIDGFYQYLNKINLFGMESGGASHHYLEGINLGILLSRLFPILFIIFNKKKK